MPHQPITDAELDEIWRQIARFTADPNDHHREAEAARHLPRLFAEVKRLREAEKAHWNAARAANGNLPVPS